MNAYAEKLLTADEFEATLAYDDRLLELIDGRLVEKPMPDFQHTEMQALLLEIFASIRPVGVARNEASFRPFSGSSQLRADVGVWNRSLFQTFTKKSILTTPDLIVEIISPGNTLAKSNRRRELCLKNGYKEYWLIDLDLQTVEIATAEGTLTVHRRGQIIQLTAFPGHGVAVDLIFDGPG